MGIIQGLAYVKKEIKRVIGFLDNMFTDRNKRVLILTYHMINPLPSSCNLRLRVPPECFQQQMQYLFTQGYHTISLTELVTAWRDKGSLPPKPILITFDDGYLDNYTYAFPILRQYGFNATVFVVANTVGKTNMFDQGQVPENKMADWPQLKEMADYGIEIGAHTLDHLKLTRIGKLEAFHQIGLSKRKLETGLNRPISVFSYPYGDFNYRIVQLVKKTGYLAAVTVNRGLTSPERSWYKMKRISINGECSMEEFRKELENHRKIGWRGRENNGKIF